VRYSRRCHRNATVISFVLVAAVIIAKYLHVRWGRHFRPIIRKFACSRQMFIKFSNIKFHKNHSSGNRVDACGQTDGQILRRQETLFAYKWTRLKTRFCVVPVLRWLAVWHVYTNISEEHSVSLFRITYQTTRCHNPVDLLFIRRHEREEIRTCQLCSSFRVTSCVTQSVAVLRQSLQYLLKTNVGIVRR
jgi:hypothetical protein